MKYIYTILLTLSVSNIFGQATVFVTNRPSDAHITICYTESQNMADVEVNVVKSRHRLHSVANSIMYTTRRRAADHIVYVTYCRASVIKVYVHKQIKYNITENHKKAFNRLILNDVSVSN